MIISQASTTPRLKARAKCRCAAIFSVSHAHHQLGNTPRSARSSDAHRSQTKTVGGVK
jgi:hypothetical protein